MCLIQDAYQQKLWGALEELCALLANKPLPDYYELWSTAEIDLRTKIGFAGELSISAHTKMRSGRLAKTTPSWASSWGTSYAMLPRALKT
jgi:hypothetical protein